MKKITVFCGSSQGNKQVFKNKTIDLGKAMVDHKLDLVYGGAKVGIMGIIADAVLEGGGKVTGVIPRFLQAKELAHDGLTDLILVESMHERKMKMNELCDGVIALPGGFGTMEELFEMLTWAQLGLHRKPIGLLNISGFYDNLVAFIETMVTNDFLNAENRDMLLIDESPEKLLTKMQEYQAPEVLKWLTPPNI